MSSPRCCSDFCGPLITPFDGHGETTIGFLSWLPQLASANSPLATRMSWWSAGTTNSRSRARKRCQNEIDVSVWCPRLTARSFRPGMHSVGQLETGRFFVIERGIRAVADPFRPFLYAYRLYEMSLFAEVQGSGHASVRWCCVAFNSGGNWSAVSLGSKFVSDPSITC